MIDLYSAWHGFGDAAKGALIGAAATFLVAVFGFGGLFLQMRSQGRQSRDAVAENERRRLKAAMYEDAVLTCRELADSAIELSTKLRIMMMELEVAAQSSAANQPFNLPAARFPTLASLYGGFSDAVLKFVFLVENRRFIDPRVLVFHTAMSSILHDTSVLMYSKFMEHVMPILPVHAPDGTLFPYHAPPVGSAATVRVLSEAFIDSLDDAVAYTDDFLLELQNCLLGDLFGKSANHRVPLDPKKKVITLDNAEELGQWFEANTEWGRNIQRVEAETAARFGVPRT